jgi:hypothetical protein
LSDPYCLSFIKEAVVLAANIKENFEELEI